MLRRKLSRICSFLLVLHLLVYAILPNALGRTTLTHGIRAGASGSESKTVTGHPLWPGSRFTDEERNRALYRGLKFIYRTSLKHNNFDEYGSDYLWCFYTLSVTVKDERLRQMAREMGAERAARWRLTHKNLPSDAD